MTTPVDQRPVTRLASLSKDQLDAKQLELYELIAGGPRAAGPQHFELKDSRGALNGPFGIMLHAPVPAHIDLARMQFEIDVIKDVEGVNPANIGYVVYGQDRKSTRLNSSHRL